MDGTKNQYIKNIIRSIIGLLLTIGFGIMIVYFWGISGRHIWITALIAIPIILIWFIRIIDYKSKIDFLEVEQKWIEFQQNKQKLVNK